MAVTELALLSHKTTPKSTLPTVQANLAQAAQAQATYSRHSVAILECHEDSNLIYLVGGWNSVDQHMTEWIPGSINQDLMKLLEDDIDVKRMFHLNCEPEAVVGRITGVAYGEGGSVTAIVRHFVKGGEKDDFERTWKENVNTLEDFIDGGGQGRDRMEGGWRVDQGYEAAKGDEGSSQGVPTEFVLFTKWPSVQKHLEFAQTEGFQKYGKIKEHIDGAEIQHGKVIHIACP